VRGIAFVDLQSPLLDQHRDHLRRFVLADADMAGDLVQRDPLADVAARVSMRGEVLDRFAQSVSQIFWLRALALGFGIAGECSTEQQPTRDQSDLFSFQLHLMDVQSL